MVSLSTKPYEKTNKTKTAVVNGRKKERTDAICRAVLGIEEETLERRFARDCTAKICYIFFYKCDATTFLRAPLRSLALYFIFLLGTKYAYVLLCYRKVAVVVASVLSSSSSNSSRNVAIRVKQKNIIVFEFVQQSERGCVKSVADDWFALVVDKETNHATQVCV